jgi:hypothetical protein
VFGYGGGASVAPAAERVAGIVAAAGYARLERLTDVCETALLRLHGMGPEALDQLRRALAAGAGVLPVPDARLLETEPR